MAGVQTAVGGQFVLRYAASHDDAQGSGLGLELVRLRDHRPGPDSANNTLSCNSLP